VISMCGCERLLPRPGLRAHDVLCPFGVVAELAVSQSAFKLPCKLLPSCLCPRNDIRWVQHGSIHKGTIISLAIAVLSRLMRQRERMPRRA
jgi:hypothetical protein